MKRPENVNISWEGELIGTCSVKYIKIDDFSRRRQVLAIIERVCVCDRERKRERERERVGESENVKWSHSEMLDRQITKELIYSLV